jgi:hypothetical protein
MFTMPKAADLNEFIEGGQLYWAFLFFSKDSLVQATRGWGGVAMGVEHRDISMGLNHCFF